MLVSHIGSTGRAKDWLNKKDALADIDEEDVAPCAMASWPVIGFDGKIVACCNQTAIDLRTPEHLWLGSASIDDWSTIRTRLEERALLRAIRVFGPRYLAKRYGNKKISCDGYCETCLKLSDDIEIPPKVEEFMSRPMMKLIADQVHSLYQGGLSFGLSEHAYLSKLGNTAE